MVEIEEQEDEVLGSSSTSAAALIQLGFSEPIASKDAHLIAHRSPRWWKDWDGGQIGGKPSWLEPQHLPQTALTCTTCGRGGMLFLCQLYVPLDNNPKAFHRSFYVFGCPKCCRQEENNHHHKGIRVLRVQLPEENPYYPKENETASDLQAWNKHLPSTWGVRLCQVCGQRATGKCPLQQLWFCGKEHQKEYKQCNSNSTTTSSTAKEKDSTAEDTVMAEPQAELIEESDNNAATQQEQSTQNDSSLYLPSVYAESELVVEEEPPAGSDNVDNDDDDDEIEQRPAYFEAAKDGEHDSDEDLEQEDLNEMITGTKIDKTATKDPTTNQFYHRIQSRKVPDQCLRYNMHWRRTYDNQNKNMSDDKSDTDEQNTDKDPLWIRSDHQPSQSDIPPCPYCQSPRAFEFQLMPQMLSFLHANRKRAPQNSTNDTAKQALIAAQKIIENSDPSQISPSFAEAKAKALEALQKDLYRDETHRVDWGVVAIYTCTASCSRSSSVTTKELGVYQEEFAWVQPALDV